jgi:two-component system, NtrC family, response regulator
MTVDKSPLLLIVEDDLALQKQIKWSLDRFESIVADDRATAMAQCRRHRPAVVTMDLGLPPEPDVVEEGFKLLKQMIEFDPDVKVIVLTGQNDHANALRAIDLGAYDFLGKPFEPEVLGLIVGRAFRLFELQAENRRLRESLQPDGMAGLVTRDPGLLKVCRTVEKVASSNATVLLLGESGTGKEVIAQALHQASKRPGKFVAINCAAIPENLLESELFGYEKGSFTGASKSTVGRIETANGGTLMLDEIGDLPQSLQAKLLRFLQERTIERIGGRQEIAVDVRVVGATHQDLTEFIKTGQFRQDLYYRLAEIVIEIPPVRSRQGDAVLLAHVFLRRFAREQKRASMSFSDDALRAIGEYPWPGNVRELLNAVKRVAIMAEGNIVTAEDLGLPRSADSIATEEPSLDLRAAREAAERATILAALARADGNIVKTAEMLAVTRPTLYDLMRRLSIQWKDTDVTTSDSAK